MNECGFRRLTRKGFYGSAGHRQGNRNGSRCSDPFVVLSGVSCSSSINRFGIHLDFRHLSQGTALSLAVVDLQLPAVEIGDIHTNSGKFLLYDGIADPDLDFKFLTIISCL